MTKGWRGLVFLVALGFVGEQRPYKPLLAAQVADKSGIGCVQELTVPGYTFVARRAPSGGKVRAVISVGTAGKPAKIETFATSQDLADEVRDYLAEEASFSKSCSGTRIEILFTFRQEGEPVSNPQVKVRFQPPNHFILITRPRQPVIN